MQPRHVQDSICGAPGALLRSRLLLGAIAAGFALYTSAPAVADNSVQLKVLVVSTEADDQGLAYIRPVLDEKGVPYEVLDASTQTLTATTLSPGGCTAATVGCLGNYNGVILTLADMAANLTPAEWDLLHQYERDFRIREAVLGGWPDQYWDPNDPWGVYLDYGVTVTGGGLFPDARWINPAGGTTVFEYVNAANPLPVTDWAFAATPRNDALALRDGTVPSVEPLLTTTNGALISIMRYYLPNQPTTPVREVMLSTIGNVSFLVHSQVLAYEFVNFAAHGVFVGGRFVYMSAHLDNLFIPDELWNIGHPLDPTDGYTDPTKTYRLTSADIANAVSTNNAFRAAYPTVSDTFKLDFPFNGAGAVADATATTLTTNLTDDPVAAVVTNKSQFGFINHTFSHADMGKAPQPANAPCDYPTPARVANIQQEINKNRTVGGLLALPEHAAKNRALVSGNHSGLKDRNCTDIPELHPGMDVQPDDVPFPTGANPLFLRAAATRGVDYLAFDQSQVNQNVERYISQVNDGRSTDRIMLPRWPTNVFCNAVARDQLVDEYNYIFYHRHLPAAPCQIPRAICTPRDYAQILAAESATALRNMLTFKKWPHYFHQTNLAQYDTDGSTLQFDRLSAVVAEYEKLFRLPLVNHPFYLIGHKTRDSLIANSATIAATRTRDTNMVTLAANETVPTLLVTGLQGGNLCGGQLIREVGVSATPTTISVNQCLTQ